MTTFLLKFFADEVIVIKIVNEILLCSLQALNKKEHKGCESPENEGNTDYVLTPNTEEKYRKINQEFENMMRLRGPNNTVRQYDNITTSLSFSYQHKCQCSKYAKCSEMFPGNQKLYVCV